MTMSDDSPLSKFNPYFAEIHGNKKHLNDEELLRLKLTNKIEWIEQRMQELANEKEICLQQLSKISTEQTDKLRNQTMYVERLSITGSTNVVNVIERMQNGSIFLKFSKYGQPKKHIFEMTNDKKYIRWYSKNKTLTQTSIPIDTIIDVQYGYLYKQNLDAKTNKYGISLTYNFGKKVLEIVAQNGTEFDIWCKGFAFLLEQVKERKNNTNKNKDIICYAPLKIPNEYFCEVKKTDHNKLYLNLKRLSLIDKASVRNDQKIMHKKYNEITKKLKYIKTGNDNDIKAIEVSKDKLDDINEEMNEIEHEFEFQNSNILNYKINKINLELKVIQEKMLVIENEEMSQ